LRTIPSCQCGHGDRGTWIPTVCVV
jgi:hypothetical protein